MVRWIVLITIATALLLVGLSVIPHRERTRCLEDMPCWNCHTMGNRICGPGA
jgi:hypothetical protein